MLLLLGCAPTPRQPDKDTPGPEKRVSDGYSREAVASYELFETDIPDHVMMRVRLTTGECFPMLCHQTDRGVYPIPQSVFATPGAERWSIMCEPEVHKAHALMRLDLSMVDGALCMTHRKLKVAAKVPLLSAPPR